MVIKEQEDNVREAPVPGDLSRAPRRSSRLVRLLRRTGTNVALLLFGILIAIGASEVAIRTFGRAPERRPFPPDRPLFYAAPSKSEWIPDYDYEISKPEGTLRIATLGDSFTYPTLLQFDDVYPKRIERLLRLDTQGRPAEVINFGKMSLSTSDEAKLFKRVLAYDPDLIILQITLNDVEQVPFRITAKRNPGLYAFGPLEVSKSETPILYYCEICRFVANRIHNKRTVESLVRFHKNAWSSRKKIKRFRASLAAMHKAARRENKRLVAVIFPYFYFTIDERYPFASEHAAIQNTLQKMQIPFLDLREAFVGIPAERLQVMPGQDSHPNELAHRIAAEHIFIWLESLGFLPRSVNKINREASPRGRL